MFFITDAFAQAAGPAAPGGLDAVLQTVAPLLLIIPLFYFFLIRPQQRRMKAHQDMIGALRKGDMIVTSGGVIGKIKAVADDEVRLELAPNVEVRVLRSSIAEIRNKGEPAPANDTKPAKTAQ